MPIGQWEYKDGEMEAWSILLKDSAAPKFVYDCTEGHMLESPIELNQKEIDGRCTRCADPMLRSRRNRSLVNA